MKSLEIKYFVNLNLLFLALSTLVSWPFFCLLIWKIGFSQVDFIGLFGLFSALIFNFSFFRKIDFPISFDQRILFSLFLSLALTVFYFFRLNLEFVDINCPTNILGFVSQLKRGHFPISFLAFPDFPANYHQAFPIIAGFLSRWFSLEEYSALRILSIGLFFVVAQLIQIYFLSFNKSWWFILGTLLFFFSFGLPIRSEFPSVEVPVWLKDTSIFDYFRSNSWPLTYLCLTICLFVFKKKKLSISNIALLLFYLLILSTLNAAVHSIFLLSLILFLLYETLTNSEFRNQIRSTKWLLVFLVLGLIVVRLITTVIPTAFMTGEHYRSVHLSLRFLKPDYLFEMKGYLLQCGLLTVVGTIISIMHLLFKSGGYLCRSLSVFFLVSFFFPIIFALDVTAWDNYHKFFLTSYFAGSILLYVTWNESLGRSKFFWLFVSFVVLISSIPNFLYMTEHWTQREPTPAYDISNQDIIDDLKKLPAGQRILPYAIEGFTFCSIYTQIAAASGQFADDGYCYWFFTLSSKAEGDFIQRLTWWRSDEEFLAGLDKVIRGERILVVKRENLNHLILRKGFELAAKKLKQRSYKNFSLFLGCEECQKTNSL